MNKYTKNTSKTYAQTHTCVFKCIISGAILYILLDNSVTETF